MSSIRVEGGKKLQGRIRISGSKNSCLALMAGAALGREDVVLTKVPENTDVQIMTDLLREIGVQVEEKTPGVMVVNGAKLRNTLIPHELARKLRASFYLSDCSWPALGKAKFRYRVDASSDHGRLIFTLRVFRPWAPGSRLSMV